MAVQKPSIPSGTRDFGPVQVQKRKHILNTLEQVFRTHGYMPLETPAMENLSSLEGKYGDEGDKLLFRILDSGEYWEKFKKTSIQTNNIYKGIEDCLNDAIALIQSDNNRQIITKINEYIDTLFSDILLKYKNWSDTTQDILNVNKHLFEIMLVQFIQRVYNSKDFGDKNTLSFYQKMFIENNSEEIQRIVNDYYISKIVTSAELKKYITEKGLRYDLTVPFARYVVMNRNEITLPFKRYQMQPVWRADRPQKGRYREFWQCDADVVGSDSLLNEADLILIYLEAFKKLGLDIVVRLNNRKILEGMAALHGERSRFIEFATIIDKLDKIGYDKVMEELHTSGFAIQALTASEKIFSIRTDEFPNPYHNPVVLGALQDLSKDFEKYNIDFGLKGIEELAKVYHMIPQEWQAQVMIDPLLARGLSYYTGCIVEVVANEGTLKSSIGGGGRYDNLTGVFGLQGVSGVGISFGLDRIYDILEELKRFPEEVNQPTYTKVLFCCFDEASQLYATEALNKVRQAGIPAEVYPDLKKIGKQLDYANALKIPFAIMIGENERASGILSFKDLNSGTQESLSLETIIEKLKG
jgi:histidyl-tRNA synthetase